MSDANNLALHLALALHERSMETTNELLDIGNKYRELFEELRDRIGDYAAECDSRTVASDLYHILNTLGRTSPVAY